MNNPYYTPSELPSEPTPSAPSHGEREALRRHFSALGLAYLAMTAAYMVTAYALQYAALFLFPAVLRYWWFPWAVSLLPLYGVGLPVLWLFLRRVTAAPHDPRCVTAGIPSEKPPFGLREWFAILVMAFGCMTLGGLMGNLIMSLLSAATGYDYAFALNSMVSETPIWFTAVCTCICAPLGEELLFRKLLIDRARRYGDTVAILLSGVLFGLFHGNLFQFFYAAAVGMLLAYVYTRTGKYLLCAAMHAVINFMGSVVTPALSRLMTPFTDSALTEGETLAAMADGSLLPALAAMLLLLVWQYGTLIAGILLLARRFRRRALSVGEIPLQGRAAAAWLNPGMIACLAIMLALTAVNLIPGA